MTITTGPVSTTIVATAATLLPADSITGGTGTGVSNTLQLSGGGAFNLAALTKLTNIQVIAAQEGQGSTAQTVTLRNNLNATVNVASATGGGITIIGATNTDVINLGAGNDTVTLGTNETVNGGAGTDVYNVTKTTIGNITIKGGSGSNTLVVTGGGNATMGTKITGINAVQLATTTNFTANTTAGLTDQRQQHRWRYHHPRCANAKRHRRRSQRDDKGHRGQCGRGDQRSRHQQHAADHQRRHHRAQRRDRRQHGEAERGEHPDAESDVVHHGDRERAVPTRSRQAPPSRR